MLCLIFSASLRKQDVAPKNWTFNKARVILEAAGVEFIAENDGGAGVRLKERKNQ